MGNILSYNSITVKPAEILQVICEDIAVEHLEFRVEGTHTTLPFTGSYVKEVTFSENFDIPVLEEVANMPLHQFLAQKVVGLPFQKKSTKAWLSAFGLEMASSSTLGALDAQQWFRLNFLLAILEQHQVLLLKDVYKLDDYGRFLWCAKFFLLRLNQPLLQPAIVICDTDLSPRMAFSIERLLVVENGCVESLAIEF